MPTPTINQISLLKPATLSGNTLRTGQVLTAAVTFSEAVTVTGRPVLALALGAGNVNAVYASSNTAGNVLNFTYTVKAGDMDQDASGVTVSANSLSLGTGISIVSRVGALAADLSHAAVTPATPLMVDTIAATPQFGAGSTGLKAVGDTLSVSASESGMAYLLNSSIQPSGLANPSALNSTLYKGVSVSAGEAANISLSGLAGGIYRLYLRDAAGNISAAASGQVTLDAIAPSVAGVSVLTSTGVLNGLYNINDVLTFGVSFNEAVVVTGTPRLAVNVGGTTVYATYASGSGTQQTRFVYTLQQGQMDTNGVSFATNALELNGGTIRDAAGNAAVIATRAVLDNSAGRVDAVNPVITGLGVRAVTGAFNQTVDAGDQITFGVTFAEAVLVSGKPSLGITVGSTVHQASFASVINGNVAQFVWVVPAGLKDLNGISIAADSIVLNGGAIVDLAGNAAVLSHVAMADNSALKVDSMQGAISGISLAGSNMSNGRANLNDVITASVTFSEAVSVVGKPTMALQFGSGTTLSARAAAFGSLSADGRVANFTYTVKAGDTDTDGVSVNANSITASSTNGFRWVHTNTMLAASAYAHAPVAANSAVMVDTTAALVTGGSATVPEAVTVVAGNATLKAGEVVTVNLTMSEPVSVTGSPQLKLQIGTSIVNAAYLDTTAGGTVLRFTHTIAAGSNDIDGIRIEASGIVLNGGSILDMAGNASNIANAVQTLATVRVDTSAPTPIAAAPIKVVAATGVQGGFLNTGDVLTLTASFSEAVRVTGTPQLALQIGAGATFATQQAQYVSGSGTGLLTFQWTVPAGLSDTDGISINANALNLNGGAILDAAGNAATLVHAAVAANTAYKVDSIAPNAATVSLASGVNADGVTLSLATQSGGLIRVASEAVSQLAFTITGASGNVVSGLLNPTTATQGIVLSSSQLLQLGDGLASVVLRSMDAAGNVTTSTPLQFTLSTRPPEIAANGIRISGATGAQNGSLNAGDVVTATVTFTEPVSITGTPQLRMLVGSDQVLANYKAPSAGTASGASQTAEFTYTVQAGQMDANGISIPTSPLVLPSGSGILDASNAAFNTAYGAITADNADFRVDTVGGTVSSAVLSASSAPAGEVISIGSVITATVSLSEAVVVSGSPTLGLMIGSTPVVATYVTPSTTSTTGQRTLNFVYTVQAGQNDANGVSITANSLNANGGSITDLAGNTMTLSHAAVADNTAFVVNTNRPMLAGLSMSANGTQNGFANAGDVVTITASFSEAVTVSGTPGISLQVGSTAPTNANPSGTPIIKKATYAAGSGTDTLSFTYTVAAGDNAAAGIAMPANGLTLDGGNILTTAANQAVALSYPARAADSTLGVDTAAGVVSSIRVAATSDTSGGMLGVGDTLTFAATFSEPVVVSGSPRLDVMIGNTLKSAAYTAGSGSNVLNFTYTVVSGDVDVNGVGLPANALKLNGGSITDRAGNAMTLAHLAVADNTLYRIDTSLPSVIGRSITGASGAQDGMLNAGDVLTVTVTMSSAVNVTGAPKLQIALGDQLKEAVYAAPTGTASAATTLNFTYTVSAGDIATGGVALPAGNILLSGGSIAAAATGRAATLDMLAVAANPAFAVDAAAPSVAGVALLAASNAGVGLLKPGHVVTAAVTFSEATTITGPAQLELNVGGSPVLASYSATGSTATVKHFVHTIAAGQADDNGISIAANALRANGATIADAAGNAAVLTHGAVADNPAFRIDAGIPVVVGRAFSAASGAVNVAGTNLLNTGDVITVSVSMSEAVTVTGSPTLQLNVGGQLKAATYAAGSGSSTLAFTYTVAAGDSAPAGLAMPAGNLLLNGGQISSVANSAAANLAVTAVAGNAAWRVDAVAPTVLAAAITGSSSEGILNVGDTVTASVTFSEATTVTGMPQLALNIGGTTVQADFSASDSTATVKRFVYTIAQGQADANGISIAANALSLNGATLADAAGNAAALTHAAVADQAAFAVDALTPSITAVTLSSASGTSVSPLNGTLNARDVVTAAVTFSEAVSITGSPQLGLRIGNSTVQAAYRATGSTETVKLFVYTIAAGQTDANGISIAADSLQLNGGSVRDAAGGDALLTHAALADVSELKVDTRSPTIVGGSAAVAETVSSVSGVSVLKSGDVITASLTLSEAVVVAGSPQLRLQVGTASVNATYLDSAQEGTVLRFTHTVAPGAMDADGIGIVANGVVLPSGASISDMAGNAAVLSVAAIAVPQVTVDTAAPVLAATTPIRMVAGSNMINGTLSAGDVLTLTASFSEAVSVTGTPQLALQIGAGSTLTAQQASYEAGSGSAVLRFVWTVPAGLEDSDGISINANALNLNGGAILDAAGNAATLTHAALAVNAGYKVDSIAPDAATVSLASGVTADNVTQLMATQSGGLIRVQSQAVSQMSYAITGATGQVVTGTLNPATATQGIVLTTAQLTQLGDGQASVVVRSLDAAGNESASAPVQFTLSTRPPTIAPNGISLTGATGAQSGSLNAGDVVTATVTFSELVNITGTPQLRLQVGSTPVLANYEAPSTPGASKTARFTYTVQAGQMDANGISISTNPLVLPTGSSIVDEADVAAVLTYSTLTVDNPNFRVDTAGGTVSSATLSASSAPAGEALGVGNVITATVSLSEAVVVSGSPTLGLMIGSTPVVATYVTPSTTSTTGQRTLNFVYTVQAGQNDANGVSITANSLNANGGSITDLAGNTMTLSHAAVADNTAFVVNTNRPTLNSLSLSAGNAQNGFANAGDVVTVSASFSEAVTVSGTPGISLQVGSTAPTNANPSGTPIIRKATYASGSGTDTLSFTYTVAAGDNALSGIAMPANGLTLDGGNILTTSANQAVALSYPARAADSTLGVDTAAGVVSSIRVAATSDTSGGMLGVGDTLTFAATFSEPVVVSGSPRLDVMIGNTLKTASYSAGSGSNVLNFTYTVASGDVDVNGVGMPANALKLNGGSITDRAGNAMTLGHLAVADNTLYRIDTSLPSVIGRSITGASGAQDGMLNAGDVLTVTVTMSSAVTVTGSPRIAIDVGGVSKQATYASGSGSAELAFTYTVAAGDTDANGIALPAGNIALSGGSIASSATGRAAMIDTLAVADNAAYRVDSASPTVAGVSIVGATGAQSSLLNEGDVVTAAVTFSEATVVTGTPQLGLNIGGTVVQANYSATGSTPTVKNFVYTIAAGQTDANGISVNADALGLNNGTITDTAGNNAVIMHSAAADNASYMVDTTAPTVSSVAIVSATGAQNSFLNAGDVVTAAVTFSEATTVTGTPQLGLNIGGTVVQANYSATGSTATVKNFVYTILAGQTDANGISVNANALSLNGGSFADAAGNNAVLAHAAVADNASYKVDTTIATPTLTITDSGSSNTDGITNVNTFTVGNVAAGDTWQFTTDGGSTWTNGTGTTFTAPAGTYQAGSIRVRAGDAAGNATVTVLSSENFSTSTAGWVSTARFGSVETPTVLAAPMDGFLGRFSDNTGNQVVYKTYDFGVGNAGKTVTIDFDMYKIDSWDEEIFRVFINDQQVSSRTLLLNTTRFGGVSLGDFSNASNGGFAFATIEERQHYALTAVLDSIGRVKMGFGSTLDSGLDDESWGIDNVVITTGSVTHGNVLTIDTTIATPTLSFTDSGSSNTDGITNVNTFTVGNVAAGDSWQFSTNGGTTWSNGSGTTFTAAAGTYQPGSIRVRAVDAAGNFSDVSNTATVVIDQTPPAAVMMIGGASIIDLGSSGKLVAPIQVEGKWYYHWNRSGDGTSSGADGVTHDQLDAIFRSGPDFATLNPDSVNFNTTNIYRNAIINGVRVALPTHGGSLTASGFAADQASAKAGTSVNTGSVNNPTYDDLLAVWDASNGTGTGTSLSGTPSGWLSGPYWSATPTTSGHAYIALDSGEVVDFTDWASALVALQAINSYKNTESIGVSSSKATVAYLVNSTVSVSTVTSITGSADNLWNSVVISAANTRTDLALNGLVNGSYVLYTVDAAGNMSSASSQVLTIDSTSPTVSSLSLSASAGGMNGVLNTGDTITATVSFSEAVTVVGVPQLILNIGGSAAPAAYATGSGTNTLSFVYTVQSGQTDANGISINTNSLNLNGGFIIDTNGNAAVLSHAAVADNSTYAVDAVASTVSAVAITGATGAQGTMLNVGDIVTATVTFSEVQLVTGTPQLALNIGGTTVQANYASGAGTTRLNFTYTVASGLTDANGISIGANGLALNNGSITDIAGNASTLTHSAVADNASFQVENTTPPAAPTLAMGSSYTNYGVDATSGNGLSSIVTVTGTSGTTLNVTFTSQNGGSVVKTLTATGSAQSVSLTAAETATLNDGVVSVSATATDGAGKISQRATLGTGLVGDLPNTLNLGTVAGMNLNLVGRIVSPDGKIYYVHDQNGDGLANRFGDKQLIHNAYDALLNGGADTIATQPGGAVAGIDDERTLVTNGYTLVLPTTTEWIALGRDQANFPLTFLPTDGGGRHVFFRGADRYDVDRHYVLVTDNLVANSNWVTLSQNEDFWQHYVVFQVIPNGSFRLNNTATQVLGTTLSFEDFSSSTVTGWNVAAGVTTTAAITSNSVTAPATLSSPVGGYLGRFAGTGGNQGVSKTYDFGVANAGKVVQIDFDMIEMDSWDWETFRVYVNDSLVASKVLSLQNSNQTAVGNNGGINLGDLSVPSNGGWSGFDTANFASEEMHHFTLRGTLDANGRIKLGFGSTLNEAISNESWGVDNILIRSFTAAPASPASVSVSIAENLATSAVAYDGRVDDYGTVTYTLSGTDAALFTLSSTGEVKFVSRPDFEIPLDANGDNVYQFTLTATDTAGNAFVRNVSLSVTNVAETATAYRVGQTMIDLGGYGRLIKPVYVDGKWYYYWDRSGGGTSANDSNAATSSFENGMVDWVDHNALDKIFRFSSDFTTANPGGFGADTTNTYRYATINGVRVALPTYGGPVNSDGTASVGYARLFGTVIDNSPIGEINPDYDDLLAVIDGNNGSAIAMSQNGTPAGWASSWYGSATSVANGLHKGIHVNLERGDMNDADMYYAALEVIGTFAAISGATGMSNGALVAGSVVTASVYFTDAVTTTGTPSLRLSIGGQQVNATYAAGIGTNKLDFTYTIQAGQNDPDGIVLVQDGLSVTGGTLSRVAGGAADTAIAQMNPNGFYKVDTSAPTLDLNGAVSGSSLTSFYGAKSMPGVVLRGQDEFVDMPDLSLGGSLTFEARVRQDSYGRAARLFDYNNGTASADLFFYANPTEGIAYLRPNGATANSVVAANQYVHVAVTVQSGGSMNVYYDGVLMATASAAAATPTLTRINSWLGRSSYGSDSYLDGTIADFRIYNRARTAAEVASDALGIVDTSDTSLVAYHSFASSSASGLAGQPAGTLMNGAFVGGVTASRAIVYETSAVSQVRVTAAGMLNGAAEKLTIQGTQVSLDGTSASGSVTLDTDVWNWTASANTFTFTLASGNATTAQTDKLVQSLGYLNTQATPSEGNRTLSFVVTDNLGNQSAATVHTIMVDNTAPAFVDATTANLTLSETSAWTGQSVLSVSATDASTAAGGKITYRLTGADAARFAVDANGNVTLRQALDFESAIDANADNVYSFAVNALDEAGNFSTKNVNLTLQNAVEALDLNGSAINGSGLVLNYDRRASNVLNMSGNAASLPSLTLGGAFTIEVNTWYDTTWTEPVPIGFTRSDGKTLGLLAGIGNFAGHVDSTDSTYATWVRAPEYGNFQSNAWNHLSYVWSGNGTFTVYVNGVQQISWILGQNLPDLPTQIVFGNNNAGSRGWAGSMRDIRVYDDARTVDEIRADMRGIIDLTDADLKAHYALDGASAASSLSGQAALTLGSGNAFGVLRLLDNATVSAGVVGMKVRVGFSGAANGASEKLLIGSSTIDLDSANAGSGTFTVGSDSWSWSRSGSTLEFTTTDNNNRKTQSLLNVMSYRNDAGSVTDGARTLNVSLVGQERAQLYLADDAASYTANSPMLNSSGVWISSGSSNSASAVWGVKRTITLASAGSYVLTAAGDDFATVYLNGQLVYQTPGIVAVAKTLTLSAGTHEFYAVLNGSLSGSPGQSAFAFTVTRASDNAVVYDLVNDLAGSATETVFDTQTVTINVDMTAPVFGAAANTTTVSVAENTDTTTTVFNANATDASGSVTYALSGEDADRFTVSNTGAVTFKTRPDFENARDINGDNVYKFNVSATDANGNSAHKSVTLTVTDVASDNGGYQSPKGQSVIDLGSFGKLILPVEVNGKTFYYWDRSGDGTVNNGGQYNGGVDMVEVPNQAAVSALFKFASDFTTQNSGSQPNETFRFATLNGVRVALPTLDGEDRSNGSINYGPTQTRHADGATNNAVYDDLLAVWDAFNGVRTGGTYDNAAIALGWGQNYYLTASVADNGANQLLHMPGAYVYSNGVNSPAYNVALQVL